jgi:hypothetical protein
VRARAGTLDAVRKLGPLERENRGSLARPAKEDATEA